MECKEHCGVRSAIVLRPWSQSGFKAFPVEGVSVPAGLEGSEGVIHVKGHDGFFFLCLCVGGACVDTCMCLCMCTCMFRSEIKQC